ncbi:hypothetical protein HK098_000471 [Nowakowskiella sp. JEL0407]|nr:hypothetical protein HK098_000471 [Nowakowskiella sp. JEL0407]
MKLRKHLRTKRLTSVDQIGMDRVIDLKFGENDTAFHVIAEFYASGNIVLTDHEYKIMHLLRVVELETTSTDQPDTTNDQQANITRFAVGEIYPLQGAKQFVPISYSRLVALLSPTTATSQPDEKKKTKKKKEKDVTFKRFIQSRLGPEYGASIVEHCLLQSGIDLNAKISGATDFSGNEEILQKLLDCFKSGDEIIEKCRNGESEGILVEEYVGETGAKEAGPVDGDENTPGETPISATKRDTKWIQTDFFPFQFEQIKDLDGKTQKFTKYAMFTTAVDEYFSHLESSRTAAQARKQALGMQKKLEAAKSAHEAQIQGLVNAQTEREKQAQSIEENVPLVDAIINTIRSYLAAGMDWADLTDLVSDEKRRGNVLALHIAGFKLEIGMVTLALNPPGAEEDESESSDESDYDSDSDDEKDDDDDMKSDKKENQKKSSPVIVDVDIYSSAYANARRYYDSKKIAVKKHSKTIVAAAQALETFEKKLAATASATPKQQVNSVTSKIRKPYWFEKFLWFISSENYLVVGGKDSTQNEVLVRKHLLKGDLYVHADMHGAASVIVKNLTPTELSTFKISDENDDEEKGTNIPESTLQQAATMSIVMSRAWDAKIVTSAWWVHASQVSKTAPTGEYLVSGSFMIRGKKNWLPPVQLVYGIGMLFKIEETPEAIKSHYWERRPWGRGIVELDAVDEAKAENNNANLGDEEEIENVADEDEKVETDNSDQEDEETDKKSIHEDVEEIRQSQIEEKTWIEPNMEAVSEIIEASEETSSKNQQAGRLSAKQRRDLKKKGAMNIKEAESSEATKEEAIVEKVGANFQQTRGKRGKLKKQKEKYAEQDDEDREAVMEFLGANKGTQPKGKKAKEKAKKEEVSKARTERFEQQIKQEKELKKKVDNAPPPAQNEGVEDDHNTTGTNPQNQDDEEAAEATMSSGLSWLPFSVNNSEMTLSLPYSYLDTVSGIPTSTDVILHAIPMCGPWSSIQKFKYKAKIVPGAVKRGKAAKSVQSGFMAVADSLAKSVPEKRKKVTDETTEMTQNERERELERNLRAEEGRKAAEREKELIRVVTEQEFINALIGKVKISIIGGEEEKGKKGKKR